MSFFIENWYLFVLAAVSGGMLLWPAITGAQSGSGVSVNDAVNLINRDKAVVIDVCEPAEFAAGHVSGARNIPLGTLAAGVKGLPTNKAQPVVVVCAKGMRAAKGATVLRGLGHDNTHVLAGGLAAWREANMPIEKSEV